ncbi:MAG: class SAM-dependent methyltransferase [Rhodospirillales bacterium]|nr:class SAM-dependent methyltransferase [Rhodospirillales bacterium]
MNERELTFEEIALRHGSDKFRVHSFQKIYDRILTPRRHEPLRLLEIGVGGEGYAVGGSSLFAWRDYLPNAQIVGIDIYSKVEVDGDRIRTVVCDQSDPIALNALNREHGPFDVIIDDGSHMGPHVAMSFHTLFPLLATRGTYVIEDIQTSYWPHYGGSSLAPACFDTAVRWIKIAVDVINRGEALDPTLFPASLGFDIAELHVFHNIASFVKDDGSSDWRSRVLTEEARAAWLGHDRALHGDLSDAYQELLADPGKLLRLLQVVSGAGGLDAFLALHARKSVAIES